MITISMTRLSILVGIGLMLVGAMAYALPAHQDLQELTPALFGIVIAVGGLIAMTADNTRKHVMHLNAVLALALLVWSSIKIVPDWSTRETHTRFVADLDVLGLSAVYMYCAIKSFIAARLSRKEDAASAQAQTEAQKTQGV